MTACMQVSKFKKRDDKTVKRSSDTTTATTKGGLCGCCKDPE